MEKSLVANKSGHDTGIHERCHCQHANTQELVLSQAECCLEKSLVHQKRRDYRSACKELQAAVKLDPSNQQAWNMLGLCRYAVLSTKRCNECRQQWRKQQFIK